MWLTIYRCRCLGGLVVVSCSQVPNSYIIWVRLGTQQSDKPGAKLHGGLFFGNHLGQLVMFWRVKFLHGCVDRKGAVCGSFLGFSPPFISRFPFSFHFKMLEGGGFLFFSKASMSSQVADSCIGLLYAQHQWECYWKSWFGRYGRDY